MHKILALLGDPDAWLLSGIIFVVGLGIGLLINAVVLRAASKWVARIDVEFGKSLLISVVVAVANAVVGFCIGFAAVSVLGADQATLFLALVFSVLVGFFITAAIYGKWIKDPFKYPESKAHIGFGKGAIVALVGYLIMFVILLVAGTIAIGVMTGMGMRVPGLR